MPDWEPNRARVNWDHDASEAAIAALRRAADKLDLTTGQRERVAGPARVEWRGRYREQFDRQYGELVSRARGLAGQYRDAADQIARASQQAWEEQGRRNAEIARWEAEKEAEERARREAESWA